jgi:hypothetical protein
MKKIISIIYILISCATLTNADNISKLQYDYELKCGINIGGTAPLSMPREIRSIDSYNPRFNGVIEGDITRWMNDCSHWGISAGLRIETKSMTTGATVKSYQTEVIDDGSKVSGYWTGYVNTKYSTTLLSIPVMANYRLGNNWKFRAGMYLSYALHREFTGYVTDGYLRQGTPIGQKLQFSDGKRGTYDFSSDLRKLQPGIQLGASWMTNKHFSINADMQFGLSDIFHSNFKTVTFNMYPIYMNIGWGYRF